jgi:predicted MFS family arabinose efflux permease
MQIVPFFYIQYYSITTGATDPNLGFYLLAIINSASVFGRTLPNLVAGKIGGLNIITPMAGITALLIWILLAVSSAPGVIVFCILYGFTSGTFVSLPPSIYVSLTKDRRMIGTRMGMGFACMSFGVLAGTPIAGAILGPENDFTGTWIFAATLVTVGTVLFVASRVCWKGWGIVKA